jgi:hypothetical protein
MQIPLALANRYRRLFRFYDRDRDGVHSLAGDFTAVAHRIHARWGDRPTPVPELLDVLLKTYSHEHQRRDRDGSGSVDLEEFIDSHARVIAAFHAEPQQARRFIAMAAGGFFDVLDLDGDGVLQPADLEAFAAAYDHPPEGITANLNTMLAELDLPPDRLPRQAFLLLVEQFWFDPSPTTPGRRLFDGVPL